MASDGASQKGPSVVTEEHSMSIIWVVIHVFVRSLVPKAEQTQKLTAAATRYSSLEESFPLSPGFPKDTLTTEHLPAVGNPAEEVSPAPVPFSYWLCAPTHWRHNLCLLSLILLEHFASSKFSFECYIHPHWTLNLSWSKFLPLYPGHVDFSLYL